MKRGKMKPRVKLVSIVFLVLCFALLALLPSCSGRRSADKLESARWILTAYAVDGSMQDALPTPAVDATFADGKVSGNGGVNQYSGSYEVDGSNLKISALASTQMAGEPAVMDQESAFFANLEAANAYKVDGDTLTIRNVSADTILEFSAADE
jgi:heat shock protein HslJ